MEKHILGNTGIEVTPVGMGVLTVGRTQLNYSVEHGAELVRYALERGINFLDTAEYYETYPQIRLALKTAAATVQVPVIASKSLARDYRGMLAAVEDYRRTFDRDVADIFLLHEVREAPDFESRAGAWECLNDLKAKGIIRAIGLSTHHVDAAKLNAELAESDILFPLINKYGLGIRHGAGAGTAKEMAAAIRRNAERGKGVFAMKAFGGGNHVADYRAALDYVRDLPGISSIMVGLGTPEEVDRLIEYAENRLADNYAPDISEKTMRIDAGDCEGCGACIKRCPNKAISLSPAGVAEIDSAVCLTCGYCAPVCPTRALIMF
ncbi:MAG: aldo/keto reductase [Clostridiales Family XIII bacterium]|jgi:aryl-alcohol dehydrogenase-like predicted oxidoreductase|nr:aldo/keto reductase [Clostridiales Family XIII bacterium]